jgi:putative DNA methylase
MTFNVDTMSISPQIASLPNGTTARLLDNGMLHYEASLAGSAERYGRGETSHTIHVWWARRPHSAMRSLVFASLCQDNISEASAVLKQLGCRSVVSDSIVMKARRILETQYEHPPRLLDMFGGGGTIPMEAANLGAETYAIDANQLSVFIQQCNLVYSQECLSKDIGRIVKASGTRVLNQLTEETSLLFPLREKALLGYSPTSPYGYLWTYTLACPSCGYRLYLSKRPWLSRKKGRRKAIIIEDGKDKQSVRLGEVEEDYKTIGIWSSKNGTIQCTKCKTQYSGIDIRNCEEEIVALVRRADGIGKEFLPAVGGMLPSLAEMKDMEYSILKQLGADLPQSQLPHWSGIVNPAIYGVRTHADCFNRRQRLVLLLLIKVLKEEYARLKVELGETVSLYVISLLSSLVDQLADWNCRFSMWIPQNEQVGRAFCGPGVSMLWDYVETDPLLNGPANLWGKLQRIVAGIKSIPKFPYQVHIQQGYAQELPFPSDFFDAIVTDPPYYDNLYYNVLADFFYVWKRLLLDSIVPDLFTLPQTDSCRELVASTFRSGTSEKAHSDYCDQIRLALHEAERVLKLDGIFSFLYTHSSLKGWEAILKGYRDTNLLITSVQPLTIERRQRPRAMTSEAVNTCIVFVAHKTEKSKEKTSLVEVRRKLEEIYDTFAPNLQRIGWTDIDTAMAIFANGVGMLANAQSVEGSDTDAEALRAIESVVKHRLPSFSLRDRDPL